MAGKTLTASYVLDASGVGRGQQQAAAYLDKIGEDADKASGQVDNLEHSMDQLNRTVDAKVEISGDPDERLDDVQAKLVELGKAVVSARVLVDDNEGQAVLSDLEAKLVRLDATTSSPKISLAGIADAESKLIGIQTTLGELRDEKIAPTVTVDDDVADERLTAVKASVDELSSKVADVRVLLGGDADVDQKLLTMEATLDRLGAKLAKPTVDVGGVPEAEAKVLAVQAELDELSDKVAKPNIDTSGIDDARTKLSDLGSDASNSEGHISGLVAALASIAPAIIPIGAAATGALAALPAFLAGAASGAAALGLGFSGISAAVKAMGAPVQAASSDADQLQSALMSAAQSARTSAESVTNSQQSLADAVSTASYDQQTAAESLAKAEQAVAQARVNDDQQVQSAERSLADAVTAAANARTTAAQQVKTAEESLVSAEQTLSGAEHNELEAQQALTQARQDAADQLVNLNDQVKDGALAQQQAALDLQTAQAALAAGPQSGGPSEAQLTLTYETAKQHVQDLADQQAQLVQQTNQANQAGVNGSSQVQDALYGVQTATQDVGNAQRGLADAAAAVTAAQKQGAQQIRAADQAVQVADQAVTQAKVAGAAAIVAAQQEVSDTERSNARQASQDAEAVTKAEQGVSDAIEEQAYTAKQSAMAIAEAQKSGTSSASTLATAMAALTPAGRQFATFIHDQLMPQFDQLKAKTQSALLPGIQAAIAQAEPALTAFAGSVVDSAKDISGLAGDFSRFLASTRGLSDLNTLLSTGNQLMGTFGHAGVDGIEALMNVGGKAGPIIAGIEHSVSGVAGAFLRFSTSGGLTSLLGYIEQNGPLVAHLFDDLTGAVSGVVKALAPAGSAIVANLGPAVKNLTPGLVAMAGALGQVLQAAAPILPPLGTLIGELARLAGDVATINPTFTAIAGGGALAAVGAGKLAGGLGNVIGKAAGAAEDLAHFGSILHGGDDAAKAAGPVGKLAESLGKVGRTAPVQALGSLAGKAKDLAARMLGLSGATEEATVATEELAPAEDAAAASAGGMDTAMDANPIGLIALAVAGLAAGLYELIKHFDAVSSFLHGPWGTAISGAVAVFMPFIGIPMLVIGHWKQLLDFFEGLWHDVSTVFTDAIGDVEKVFTDLPGKAIGWLKDTGTATLTGLWDGISGAESTLVGDVAKIPGWIETTLADAASWLVDEGEMAVRGLWSGFVAYETWLATNVAKIPGWIEHTLADAATWLVDTGEHAVTGLWHGMTSAFTAVTRFVEGIPHDLLTLCSDAGHWLYSVGGDVIKGLGNGMVDWAQDTIGHIPIIGGKIVDMMKDALGVHSPSTIFAQIGRDVMAGLDQGLTDGATGPLGTVKALSDQIGTVPFTAPLPAAAVAAGGSSGALAGAGDTYNVTVEFNVNGATLTSAAELRTVAVALGPAIRQELIGLSQTGGSSKAYL